MCMNRSMYLLLYSHSAGHVRASEHKDGVAELS